MLFYTGVLYTIVSFLLGSLLDFADIDGDIDGDLPWLTVSPLKPIVIVSFITVFGGMGIIGDIRGWSTFLNLCISTVSALFVAFIIYRYVVVPLYRIQNSGSVSQNSLVGIEAVVISPIMEKGYGTISYSMNNNKYTSPAKHIKGNAVLQNTVVEICEIKDSVFYVKDKNIKKIRRGVANGIK